MMEVVRVVVGRVGLVVVGHRLVVMTVGLVATGRLLVGADLVAVGADLVAVGLADLVAVRYRVGVETTQDVQRKGIELQHGTHQKTC